MSEIIKISVDLTFGFRKFISKHGSILYVDREWRICAFLSCRYNFPIKKLKGLVDY